MYIYISIYIYVYIYTYIHVYILTFPKRVAIANRDRGSSLIGHIERFIQFISGDDGVPIRLVDKHHKVAQPSGLKVEQLSGLKVQFCGVCPHVPRLSVFESRKNLLPLPVLHSPKI